MELLEMIQKDRISADDLVATDRVVIDRDGCEFESMFQYWDRFPNATVHAGTFYLEWGSSDDSSVLIMVNHEAGAWQIGVYPVDMSTDFDWDQSPKWFARVVDEKSAVLTLHVLTEVL